MNNPPKKSASIKAQVLIRFGFISLVLVAAGFLFLLTSWNVNRVQEKAALHSGNKLSFQQAVSDHYRWAYQFLKQKKS